MVKLFSRAINWKSTKQKTVTTSGTAAELLALTYAAKEIYWWRRLFSRVFFQLDHPVSVDCDNQQTIRLLTKDSPQLTTRLRHIDIHQHWLRQEVQQSRLQINWVPTTDMPADGLTKGLTRQKHEAFVRQLGLVDIRDRVEATDGTGG